MLVHDSSYDIFLLRTKFYPQVEAFDLHNISESAVHFAHLDIFWTEENATHVWVKREKITHSKSTLFPLALRPFHGRMLPGPRDPRKALDEMYGHTSKGLRWVLGKDI